MKYTTLQEINKNNYSFCIVQLDFQIGNSGSIFA